MSDNATADTPPNDPPPAVPVVDARTNEAVSEHVPAAADPQTLIEQGGAQETAFPVAPGPAHPAENEARGVDAPAEAESDAPATPVTTDDWSIQPEPAESEAKKPTKKARSKAAKAAESGDADDADATPADDVAPGGAADPDATPTGTMTPAEVPAEEAPPENKKKWYAIKVQSGREDTIRAAILRKIAIEGLEEGFGQIMVPVDKIVEKRAVKVKDKKTGEYTTVERKVEKKVKKFQGYIFAELELNDRLLYVIRETSGVGDFLKLRPRKNDTPLPEPMTDAEVKQMLGEKVGPESGARKVKIEFEKGDRVRIKEGSFKDTEGDVNEVILPKDPTDPPKVKVTVTFWGRPLDVELEYWQVAKV